MLFPPSFVGFTKSVAPNFFPHASLASFTSTTMIFPAPFFTHPGRPIIQRIRHRRLRRYAFLDACSNNCCTIACRNTTAKQACTVHGCFGSDGYNRYVCNHGVLREGGGPHEMKQFLALALESRCTVRHYSFALCSPDLAAKICLARLAEFAFTALGRAKGEMISKPPGLGSGDTY